jgi:hypothetical protein
MGRSGQGCASAPGYLSGMQVDATVVSPRAQCGVTRLCCTNLLPCLLIYAFNFQCPFI